MEPSTKILPTIPVIDQEKFVKELLNEHNKCRKDPLGYSKIIETHLTYFTDEFTYKNPHSDIAIKTTEGKKAYQECIAFLTKQEPLGTLDLCEGMCKSSEDHVNDLGPKGITGHDGTDGSKSSQRIERYVNWGVTCSENITFGPITSEDIVVGLIVDDAVPDRGHRTNIFNKDLKFMGAFLGPHKEIRFMCVMNYAGQIIEDKLKGLYFKSPANETIKTMNNTKHNTKNSSTFKSTKPRKKLTDMEKRVKHEDFFGKMKKIRQTGLMLIAESDYNKMDEHLPPEIVSVTIKKVSSFENGRLTKRIYKTYLRMDGSKHVVEYEDKS